MKKDTVKKSVPAPNEGAKQEMAQIPVDVLNKVLGYLSEKPFKEVQGLISSIQQNSKLI
jgi:hypothetical protein